MADALSTTMRVPTPKSRGCSPFAIGYAIVAMNLKRGDPILRTEAAVMATDKEIGMLVKSGAFNLEEVMEESGSKYWYPEAHFLPPNPIYAVKHWELLEKYHVLKR